MRCRLLSGEIQSENTKSTKILPPKDTRAKNVFTHEGEGVRRQAAQHNLNLAGANDGHRGVVHAVNRASSGRVNNETLCSGERGVKNCVIRASVR